MRQILEIDQKDLGPYIKSGGIKYTPVIRCEKSVVTMNGTLHKFNVKKACLNVELLDMNDESFQEISSRLKTTPTYVKYVDLAEGRQIIGKFHISDLKYTAKKSIGNIGYWTGISFKLEEV